MPIRLFPPHRRDALNLGAILVAALVAMLLVQGLGAPFDVDHYKFWTKLVTEGGIHAAYSGTFPHTYAIYPPLTLYFYWAIGHAYQAFVDPTFDMSRALADPTLTFMIKLPGMLFHLLTVALIYALLRQAQGTRRASIGAAVYALQPGVLFDIAVWGQPDSVHSFFVILAVALLLRGRPNWAGAAYGLAAITKPQSWILAPLLLFYTWRQHGVLRTAKAGAIAVLAALPLTLPFWLFGSWKQLLRLPEQISRVAPWVSANAHNLWWLFLGENATAIPDFDRSPLGPGWFTLSLVLVGGSVLFALARLRRGDGGDDWRGLTAVLAFQCFAFFFLVTKAHENHAFLVLPLLSLLWLRRRGIAALYLGVSTTFLLNLVLHDPTVAPWISTALLGGQLKAAQFWNSAANLALLVTWMVALLADGLPAVASVGSSLSRRLRPLSAPVVERSGQ